ncbi:hypothetical protein J4Q44_G00373200 [Coregonus suidteri]|uniref:Uncharacterized protein n=1 Tax=Coregonus suidteri TaxID=861788 RepID=A0AAN8KV21_9TELE
MAYREESDRPWTSPGPSSHHPFDSPHFSDQLCQLSSFSNESNINLKRNILLDTVKPFDVVTKEALLSWNGTGQTEVSPVLWKVDSTRSHDLEEKTQETFGIPLW